MIAWTKARRFPGVRWCTSSTMAVLPLYLIAIPLRRSFAAAIELKFLVESTAIYKSSRAGLTKPRDSAELKRRAAANSKISSKTPVLLNGADGRLSRGVCNHLEDRTPTRGPRFAGVNAQAVTAPTSQLKQFQFRQILRIDDSDRHAIIIHHHEIVDPMTLEQVEHFDC